MSFLDSFSSEYRTFKRIPCVGQTKNAIGEIEKTEMLEVDIIGILLEKKKNSFAQAMMGQDVNYDKTDRVFFFRKGVVLNKGDIIKDEFGSEYKVIKSPKRQIVFNAQYDHNVASLSLIE